MVTKYWAILFLVSFLFLLPSVAAYNIYDFISDVQNTISGTSPMRGDILSNLFNILFPSYQVVPKIDGGGTTTSTFRPPTSTSTYRPPTSTYTPSSTCTCKICQGSSCISKTFSGPACPCVSECFAPSDCAPTTTTSSTCTCTAWQDSGCNLGGCVNQMRQTRSCTPYGCQVQSRCVSSPSCVTSSSTTTTTSSGQCCCSSDPSCVSGTWEPKPSSMSCYNVCLNSEGYSCSNTVACSNPGKICNPGQVKSGTTCLVCNSQGSGYVPDNTRCGGTNGKCNADGTCQTQQCGGKGQACCTSGISCNSGLTCQNNVCQTYCPSGYYSSSNCNSQCSSGLECRASVLYSGCYSCLSTTSTSTPTSSCGNGKCDSGETCNTCSKDCGICPGSCDETCKAKGYSSGSCNIFCLGSTEVASSACLGLTPKCCCTGTSTTTTTTSGSLCKNAGGTCQDRETCRANSATYCEGTYDCGTFDCCCFSETTTTTQSTTQTTTQSTTQTTTQTTSGGSICCCDSGTSCQRNCHTVANSGECKTGLGEQICSSSACSTPKQSCPYECCLNEPNYYDKLCLSSQQCQNHKCVTTTTTQGSGSVSATASDSYQATEPGTYSVPVTVTTNVDRQVYCTVIYSCGGIFGRGGGYITKSGTIQASVTVATDARGGSCNPTASCS